MIVGQAQMETTKQIRSLLPIGIQMLFWIGTLYCVYTGITWIIWSTEYDGHQEGWLWGGLLYIVLGPVLIHFYCLALRLLVGSSKSTEIEV